MSKTYKIISKEPAPERVVNVFSISDLIQFSAGLSNDALEEWFTEYRYDAEISQGEVFHNKSKFKEVEFPDGTTKINEIPVDGNGFDEEELELVKKMQDLDILIKGELEWTGGTWNTFSIELDDSEEFDLKKIKAEGDCGLIINYTYDGNDFTNDEDWLLSDGYSNIEVSIFYDGSLHKIELDELRNELEEKGIDTKIIDSDALSNCLIEKIKNQEILSETESQDVLKILEDIKPLIEQITNSKDPDEVIFYTVSFLTNENNSKELSNEDYIVIVKKIIEVNPDAQLAAEISRILAERGQLEIAKKLIDDRSKYTGDHQHYDCCY
jgi:hypothetical protein